MKVVARPRAVVGTGYGMGCQWDRISNHEIADAALAQQYMELAIAGGMEFPQVGEDTSQHHCCNTEVARAFAHCSGLPPFHDGHHEQQRG